MIDAIAGDAPREVSILAYGAGRYLLGDFSSDPEAVHRALSKLTPCDDLGVTTIDTVYAAIDRLKQRLNRYRRAILLIGETRDHGSRSKLQDVVAELGMSNTVIYSLAFSPTRDEFLQGMRYGNHPPPVPKFGSPNEAPAAYQTAYPEHASIIDVLPAQLQPVFNALQRNAASELALLSGGQYLNFTTRKGFETGLQRIANQIHNYYLLSFRPSTSAPLTLHSLEVRVAGYPDAVIQTRKSYWAR